MVTCAGTTKAGARCKKQPVKGSVYCSIHGKSKPAVTKKPAAKGRKPAKKALVKPGKVAKEPETEMPDAFSNEVVLYNLLLSTNPRDLNKVCNTNTQFAKICATKLFKKAYISKWGEIRLPNPLSKYKFKRFDGNSFDYVFKNGFIIRISIPWADKVLISFGIRGSEVLTLIVKGVNVSVVYYSKKIPGDISRFDLKYLKTVNMFTKSGKVAAVMYSERAQGLLKKFKLEYLLNLSSKQAAEHLKRIAKEAVAGL